MLRNAFAEGTFAEHTASPFHLRFGSLLIVSRRHLTRCCCVWECRACVCVCFLLAREPRGLGVSEQMLRELVIAG